MKKFFSLFLATVLMLGFFPVQQNAHASEDLEKYEEYEKDDEFTEVTITEDLDPDVEITDPTTSANAAITEWAPEGTDEVVPTGLSFARGTVSCYTISKNAYCPWVIQIGGDVISHSQVKVEIQKHHGISGGWKSHKNISFNYPIYRPTATIRNEASAALSKGSYRVRLGGKFLTVKNGWYQAWANGWAYFEVK